MISKFDERESIVREIASRRSVELGPRKPLADSIDYQDLGRTETCVEVMLMDRREYDLKMLRDSIEQQLAISLGPSK